MKLDGPFSRRRQRALPAVLLAHARAAVPILLAVVTGTSAFTVGSLMAVGLEFLPIINKGDLLILLTFYTAALLILISLGRYVFTYTAPAAVVICLQIMRILRAAWTGTFGRRPRVALRYLLQDPIPLAREYFRLSGVRPVTLYGVMPFGLRIGSILVQASLFALTLVYLLGLPIPRIDLSAVVASLGHTRALPPAVFFGVGAFAIGKGWLLGSGRGAKVATPLVTGIAIIFGSFAAGGIWIEYLRVGAPRVPLTLVSDRSHPHDVTIAMPASEGILVFVQGNRDAVFVPWHSIENIGREVTPLQPLPRGKLCVDPCPKDTDGHSDPSPRTWLASD